MILSPKEIFAVLHVIQMFNDFFWKAIVILCVREGVYALQPSPHIADRTERC